MSHTALAYFFPSQKQLVWNGKHPGRPLERTSWGGISKARTGVLGNLCSAPDAVSGDLKAFIQGSPVLNSVDVQVL